MECFRSSGCITRHPDITRTLLTTSLLIAVQFPNRPPSSQVRELPNHERVDLRCSPNKNMAQKLPKRVVWIAVCFALVLVVLVIFEVAGIVPPRVFGVLCLVAMIVAAIAFWRVFKTLSLLPASEGERPRVSSRKRWFVLVGALIWLVLGFWLTRGQPLLPRLVGAAVVVLFVSPYAMRKRK